MAFWAKNARQFGLGTSSFKLTAHEKPGLGPGSIVPSGIR